MVSSDVSIRAGVSKATVSRVLNGTGQVKESTRNRFLRRWKIWAIGLTFSPLAGKPHENSNIGLVVSTFDGFCGRLLQQASHERKPGANS